MTTDVGERKPMSLTGFLKGMKKERKKVEISTVQG
jgi:hypothetical protein